MQYAVQWIILTLADPLDIAVHCTVFKILHWLSTGHHCTWSTALTGMNEQGGNYCQNNKTSVRHNLRHKSAVAAGDSAPHPLYSIQAAPHQRSVHLHLSHQWSTVPVQCTYTLSRRYCRSIMYLFARVQNRVCMYLFTSICIFLCIVTGVLYIFLFTREMYICLTRTY